MHVSEGVLAPSILGVGWFLTIVGIGVALRGISYKKIPEIAVLSSVFFIASLIHIPIGPTAAHLILNGLVGLLLGWAAFVAIFVGLFLQALFFQFGGFTTLGINTLNMAFPGLICWYLFRVLINNEKPKLTFISGFLSGFISILGAGLLTALSLYFTEKNFLILCKTLVIAHIPVAFVEGLITAFIVVYLLKLKPEVFNKNL